MTDMAVTLWGKIFKNPVWSASGCFGYGFEAADFFDPAVLGAVVTKGISQNPWPGNPPPRVYETPAGMLNSIGLQNVGLNAFLEEKLPALAALDTAVVVNFLGHREDEYYRLAEALGRAPGIDALEMNLSCPNVDAGGMVFGTSVDATFRLVKNAKALVGSRPLIAKLSPNVTDIAAFAQAAQDAGADAVSLVNTLLGMAVDVRTRRPVFKRVVGGLSGPAIKPVALRMVWQVAKAVDIPVIGMGGIASGEDAAAFLLAGASAVQVGSAGLRDPLALPRIIAQLEELCASQGVTRVTELTGALEEP